jgi:hypothetical protein
MVDFAKVRKKPDKEERELQEKRLKEAHPDIPKNKAAIDWLQDFYIFDPSHDHWMRRCELFLEVRYCHREAYSLIYWSQPEAEFKADVNFWFDKLAENGKIKRKDEKPLTRKNVVVEHKQDKFYWNRNA